MSMRQLVRFLAAGALSAAVCPTAALADGQALRWRADGEAFLKYNTNLSLADGDSIGARDAPLSELNGSIGLAGTIGGFRLDSEISGLANLHAAHRDEDWFFTRSRLGLRRPLGPGTAELSDEARYYTVPDQDAFDFIRNVAQLAYRLPLPLSLEVRGGYANIRARYLQSPEFDYTVHGANVVVRRRWSDDLSTWAQLDVQSYTGTSTPREIDGSPRDGQRLGLRLGMDGLFGNRHSLSATYAFQTDEADLGVKQIGDPENPESTQDIEAEFDLRKHKATVLYAVPLNRRWLLSSYNEWIGKLFDDEFDVQDPFQGRTDDLLLSSTHLRYRLDERWSLKLRYLLRVSDSSYAPGDYVGHLISVGVHLQH